MTVEPHQECLYWSGNVLQNERSKLLEGEVEPTMHMIAHGSRNADATRRTFRL